MQTQQVADKAATIMPAVIAELERLVAIPSVAFPGYPPEPVDQMAAETLQMFRDVGFENAQFMEVPKGYPPIYAEIQGPPGSPVVMLYAHYDVQPAPPEQGWTSDPWTATTKADGRIYGRGAADDKGGLACHLGTMRVFDGKPPCTIKLILEGMEETASNLEAFVERTRTCSRVTCSWSATWATCGWESRCSPPPCGGTSPRSSRCAPSITRSTPACSAGLRPTP